jgi:hypothetical protein
MQVDPVTAGVVVTGVVGAGRLFLDWYRWRTDRRDRKDRQDKGDPPAGSASLAA